MKLIIYTDGGARGNPGPAAVGVVFYNEEGQKIKEYGEPIGNKTNNEAEYQAVILAIKKAKLLFGKEKIKKAEVNFYLDSELVVKQLSHIYKIEEERLQLLFVEIWNLLIDLGKFSFFYIPREKNKEADRMVNLALDEQASRGQKSLF